MKKFLFQYIYSNNVDGEDQDLMVVHAEDVDMAIYYFETWSDGIGVKKYCVSEVNEIIFQN